MKKSWQHEATSRLWKECHRLLQICVSSDKDTGTSLSQLVGCCGTWGWGEPEGRGHFLSLLVTVKWQEQGWGICPIDYRYPFSCEVTNWVITPHPTTHRWAQLPSSITSLPCTSQKQTAAPGTPELQGNLKFKTWRYPIFIVNTKKHSG